MPQTFSSKILMIFTTNFRILHQLFRLGCFQIMCPVNIRHSNQRCPPFSWFWLDIAIRECEVLAILRYFGRVSFMRKLARTWYGMAKHSVTGDFRLANTTVALETPGVLARFIHFVIYDMLYIPYIYIYIYIYMCVCVSSKQYGHFVTLGFRVATLQANAYKPFYSFKHETHYWRRPTWNCIHACRERMRERKRDREKEREGINNI